MKPFPLCQCQRRPHVGNIVIPLWLCLLLTPIAMNHMGPFTNAALNTAGGDGSKSLCSPQKALQWNSMFGGGLQTQTFTHESLSVTAVQR